MGAVTSQVEEAYVEALHPRGRGGEWIKRPWQRALSRGLELQAPAVAEPLAPEVPPEGTNGWESLASSARAWAEGIGETFDAPVEVSDVRVDPKLPDRAGRYFSTGGSIWMGRDVPKAVDRLATLRRTGGVPTEGELQQAYSAYRALAHEIGHAVNPRDRARELASPDIAPYDDAARNLDEALTEEAAHLLTVARLREEGQTDVLREIRDAPWSQAAKGVYRPERATLAELFDIAGVPPEERANMVLALKFQVPSERRFEVLRGMMRDAGQGGDPVGLMSVVPIRTEAAMVARPALGGLPPSSPVSYRRADGVYLEPGALVESGGRRIRLERLGVADGFAYAAGFTQALGRNEKATDRNPAWFDGAALDDAKVVSARPEATVGGVALRPGDEVRWRTGDQWGEGRVMRSLTDSAADVEMADGQVVLLRGGAVDEVAVGPN